MHDPAPSLTRDHDMAPAAGRWRLLVHASSLLAALIGGTALAGWLFDVPALRSVLPGAVEMKINTAIMLLASAGSLSMLTAPVQSRQRHAQWLAAMVTATGLATLAEYLLGWNLHIDELLLHDPGHAFDANPGRMSPYSAVVFTGLGIGLATSPKRAYRWLVSATALGTVTIGAVSLLGYVWKASELTTDQWLPPVAIHSALAFVLLGAGTLIANHNLRFTPRVVNLQVRGRVAAKVLVGFLVAVLLFCIGGGVTYRTASRLTDTQRLIVQTQNVRISIQQLRTAVAVATSEHRGYLLFADDEYRSEYLRAVDGARNLAVQLRQLITQEPEQLARLDSVTSLIDARLEALARHVDLHDRLGIDAIRPIIAADDSVAAVRSIRSELQAMDEIEQRRMKVLDAQLVRDRGFTLISLVATLVIGSVTLFMLFESILHDIRARARIVTALDSAQREAQRANQAKSQFLATMSHEIRTPINGIVGTLEVLQQSSLHGRQMELVDLVRESADSLLQIINDILDFSKIEAGRLDIESAPMSIGDLMEKTCNLLNRYAERKGSVLMVYVDPRIPATVAGDAARLRQVLINLIGNAIKFSSDMERPGRVSVRAELREARDGIANVEFLVADNGVGIDAAILPRLFSPFTQADASTTRRYGGSGLGLAICRQLVGLMGGDIRVQSAPQLGSAFSVRLSFSVVPAATVETPAPSAIAGLHCIVVGGGTGLADDLAAYLAADAAAVTRVPDLAAAQERSGTTPAGLTVWVVDADDDELATEKLQSALQARADLELKVVLVVIGRGRRRMPRAQAEGIITLDGNALNRRALIQAVGMAAGRIEAASCQANDEQRVRPSGSARSDAVRHRSLILVAEDSEINQQVIRQQLNLLGYTADIAVNGREALRRLRTGNYALLLTDLHMPEVDGYDLTLQVRSTPGDLARLPIVALTANALPGEAERCLAVGMNDYLTKPVPLALLDDTLSKWLPAAESAAPQPAEARRAPVDIAVLQALVGDDAAVIDGFLREFLTVAEQLVAQLSAACGAGQPREAAALAHKLKSSARSIGALVLGDRCAVIEEAGAAGRMTELAQLLPAFEREALAVLEHIRSLPLRRAADQRYA